MSRKFVFLSGLVFIFVTIVSFQNCGSTNYTASQKSLSGGLEKKPGSDPALPITEVVIDQTNLYGKIVWTESQKVFDRNGQTQTRLDVDLDTGQMNLERTRVNFKTTNILSKSSCSIEDTRLIDLDNLRKTSRVCRPPDDIQDDQANCMAIGETDIQLINVNNNQTLELRPNICHQGIFLCDGLDEQLRSLLKDLVLNPPDRCRSN